MKMNNKSKISLDDREKLYSLFLEVLRNRCVQIKNIDTVKMWVDNQAHVLKFVGHFKYISIHTIQYHWWRLFDYQVNSKY